ncbi:MAG: ABC transporter substrate-binding protein [Dehalococcoidia bacterium]|nr:ABC transporter substrate-binding protein [Dehalococcoidia bacterium]
MSQKISFCYKVIALVLVLVLLVPVLAACGDDDGEETPTGAATNPTATTMSATTPALSVSDEPVKLGILISYSGAAAKAGNLVDQILKIVDKQLEARGGINVGGVMRPVKWVKCDDNSQVSDSVTGYRKLVLQDKVSAVLFGGALTAALSATSDTAEETKVPAFTVGSTPLDLSDRPYTIRCVYPNATDIGPMVTDFALNQLKPKTAGLLMGAMKETRERGSVIKQILKAAGVDIVYEEYVEISTLDFSPFLTGVKHANPDVLFVDSGGGDTFYQVILKQIPGFGGWGKTKFISCGTASSGPALNEVGADGTYHWIQWMPGLPYPGSKIFEDAFAEQYPGVRPTSGHATIYYPFWAAITAIEMAGSDKPADIQKAARSGNFVWEDAPAGPLKINADGTHNNVGLMAYYKDGKLVPVVEQ